jgi:hypothetical protein
VVPALVGGRVIAAICRRWRCRRRHRWRRHHRRAEAAWHSWQRRRSAWSAASCGLVGARALRRRTPRFGEPCAAASDFLVVDFDAVVGDVHVPGAGVGRT